ncbi:MAG TPA: oxidoreductase [Solirubrobacteraceae bacterium]|nr:oxidoreductase [Solirubrobacteraceae bacterium]
MAASDWTAADLPDQHGQVAIVTGANSGLGFVTARELARAGATVLVASRSIEKGQGAVARIASEVPGADVSPAILDLADLRSVREFGAAAPGRVDLLINNAGIMAAPRRLTRDGFESQIGTNHLGHFALTGLLVPALLKSPAPRVVTVSSHLHRRGTMRFDDLHGERKYDRWGAYGQSKLANLMFCFELQRRATEAGAPLLSMAAHPGYASTNLQFAATNRSYEKVIGWLGNRLFAQSAEIGALPTLYAATVRDLPGGTFVGPGGRGETRGYPKVVSAAGKAYDEQAWRRLWEISEQLTGVRYEWGASEVAA